MGSRRAVLALLCVAQFIDVLGVTVAVVALPSIARDLDMDASAAQWVVGGYALCFGGLLLLAGRAADLFGRRRVFVAGLLAFAATALACGLAPGGAFLLAARAAQGAAAALVVPSALALLTAAFPEGPQRVRALAVWTAAAAGGGAAGFAIGGLITAAADWRWTFLLTVPAALAAAALAPRLLAEGREGAGGPLDVAGAVLVTAGTGAVIAALTLLAEHGPAAGALLCLAAGAALLGAFAGVERRHRAPLAPLGVLARRRVAGAAAIALVLTATTSGAAVLVTAHLQEVLGRSAAATGLIFAPFSLLVVAGSLAGPRVIARRGRRPAAALGLAGVAAGMLALATSGTATWPVVLGLALGGAGLGCASVAATGVGMAAAGEDEQGLVAGILNTATQLGTAAGVAVLGGVAAAAATGSGDEALADGFRVGWIAAAVLAAAAGVGVAAARGAAARR